jgi:hypothetical protein
METNDLLKHVMQYLNSVSRPATIVSAQTAEKVNGEPDAIVVEVCDPHAHGSTPHGLIMITFEEIG